MHDIKKAVRDYLIGSTGVRNAVGSKVFPSIAPTDADLPYIVYQEIVGAGEHHMLGASAIAHPTFQFDCYGETSVDAFKVSESVRNVLVGFRGFMGDVVIYATFLDNEFSNFEPPDDGSEEGTYRNRLDITVWYRRPVPTFI